MSARDAFTLLFIGTVLLAVLILWLWLMRLF